MGTLLDLKAEGKIRAIGVCNASAGDLAEAESASELTEGILRELQQTIDDQLQRQQSRQANLRNQQAKASIPLCFTSNGNSEAPVSKESKR